MQYDRLRCHMNVAIENRHHETHTTFFYDCTTLMLIRHLDVYLGIVNDSRTGPREAHCNARRSAISCYVWMMSTYFLDSAMSRACLVLAFSLCEDTFCHYLSCSGSVRFTTCIRDDRHFLRSHRARGVGRYHGEIKGAIHDSGLRFSWRRFHSCPP